jgi:hypothetical protein
VTVPSGWSRSVGRYLVWAAVLVVATVAFGWPFLGEAGRRAIALAGAIALPVQVGSFAALATVAPGTSYFLGVWIGSTVIRFTVIGAGAFVIAGMEGVDLLVALFGMAGLFLALMFLELWVILRDLKRG